MDPHSLLTAALSGPKAVVSDSIFNSNDSDEYSSNRPHLLGAVQGPETISNYLKWFLYLERSSVNT